MRTQQTDTMASAGNTCGCCEGTQAVTPQPTANRPGLEALFYRVGTHAGFLETMKARLSSLALEVPTTDLDQDGRPKTRRIYPLRDLTTRDPGDFSVALLDAWATVAEVLGFYQERIANEGYLRTATERRSVLELARLIGYALRPGVAASVPLALELDKDYKTPIQLYELKAQSIPGPGELPQTFENIEPLDARYVWNQLQPRLTQPQTIDTIIPKEGQKRLYVKGISANLKPNDVVLITGGGSEPTHYRVAEVKPDPVNDRTLVIFQEPTPAAKPGPATPLLKEIADIADNHADPATLKQFDIPEDDADATAIIMKLNNLSELAKKSYDTADAAEFALRPVLQEIENAKKTAFEPRVGKRRAAARPAGSGALRQRPGFSGEKDNPNQKLIDWLTAMAQELFASALNLRSLAAREIAVKIAEAINPPDRFAPAMKLNFDPLAVLLPNLVKPASAPPRNTSTLNTFALEQKIAGDSGSKSDLGLQLLEVFNPGLGQSAAVALENVKVTPDSDLRVYVFRAVARPFGYNAPLRAVLNNEGNQKKTIYEEWTINDSLGMGSGQNNDKPQHNETTLYLDGEYKIQTGSGWIFIDNPCLPNPDFANPDPPDEAKRPLLLDLTKGDAKKISQLALAAYGISGKSTLLELQAGKNWINSCDTSSFTAVRNTVVYCESEELPLAEEPIEKSICGGDQLIELDRLYTGLQAGRWLIVSGERDDIQDQDGNKVRGIKSSELVMLAVVIHNVREFLLEDDQSYLGYGPPVLPDDRMHTFITLATPLAYCYRRDTITIYGNVLKATHGETRKETLGSGDATQPFQAFPLKQPPLTFVASPTPAGAESTLKVYVNEVQWHEADSLAELSATDRRFITQIDDDGKTTVIFGNGRQGARLPTGIENIQARYRNGIGKGGNVRAEQISQLMSKPLGVKGVVNPLPASGGADRESQDTARKNAPLTVTALDRLVSISDYADFARTFAGIGKSVATRITDGKREWVHVTIAGADDIRIDQTSDLYRNLLQALHDYGDLHLPVMLQVRELLLLVISARVRILPDYQWEPVAQAMRASLLDAFSFERRELGQDVLLSEVIAVMQSIPGVVYVDIDAFGVVPEKMTDRGSKDRRLLTPKEITDAVTTFMAQSASGVQPPARVRVGLAGFDAGALRPAQVAYLAPTVAGTLALNQITS